MPLTLKNFRPIGFDQSPQEIFIDEAGQISPTEVPGATVIDAKGAWLSPGWCDLHVHIWHGGTDISVRASQAGRSTGVTAMADAGSAGEATFHGLREYVIDPQPETIKAFLNIGSIGLAACNRVSELYDLSSIDIDRTLKIAEANADVICGIKVRASGVITGTWGIGPAKIAKRVAEILNLPLMVHVGEPAPLLDEIFDILSPNDIVTHCYNGKRAGSILDTPKLFAQAKRLEGEGIRFDVGHGQESFSFSTAKQAIRNGLKPFSISTDLHALNINGPVFDLSTTMSKLMALGLSLEEVIAGVTEKPRSILGLGARTGLTYGERVDLTLFDLSDGELLVSDSEGTHLTLSKVFEPRMTILDTHVEEAMGFFVRDH